MPPHPAQVLRDGPDAVADEVEQEVRRQVPEYAPRRRDRPHTPEGSGRTGAHAVRRPHRRTARPGDAIAETYHELGRGEAVRGRGPDALRSALPVGGLHAWRLRGSAAEELGPASTVVAALGEALHADFEERLRAVSFDACGFRGTAAGPMVL